MFLHTRKLLVGLLIGLLIVTLTGCGEPSGVKTGAESDSAKSEAQSKPEENTKKVAVNKEFSVNGLKITIGEVQVEKERILVGMTIKNETSDKLTFYPDQGSAIVGSMQLDANMFMTEGDVSGDIQPGVEKSGVVVFTTPEGKTLTPEEVTSIALHLGDVFNEKSFEAKPFDTTLSLE